MTERCPECGAPIPAGGSCLDNFHALLLLEADVPGALGGFPHFFAVGTYNLQHPGGMRLTAGALAGLRAVLADVLDGRLTLEALRPRVRREANEAGRIRRRPEDDHDVSVRRVGWPMTVADVLSLGAAGYAEHVEQWARSVRETLDAEKQRL